MMVKTLSPNDLYPSLETVKATETRHLSRRLECAPISYGDGPYHKQTKTGFFWDKKITIFNNVRSISISPKIRGNSINRRRKYRRMQHAHSYE